MSSARNHTWRGCWEAVASSSDAPVTPLFSSSEHSCNPSLYNVGTRGTLQCCIGGELGYSVKKATSQSCRVPRSSCRSSSLIKLGPNRCTAGELGKAGVAGKQTAATVAGQSCPCGRVVCWGSPTEQKTNCGEVSKSQQNDVIPRTVFVRQVGSKI
jgi:hypothetical protein